MTLGLGLKSNMIPLYFDGCVQLFDHREFAINMISTDIDGMRTCLFEDAHFPLHASFAVFQDTLFSLFQ